MRLQGKKAVITGAARGIGKSIAERYVREGASVFLLDLHAEAVAAAVNELKTYGDVFGTTVDVSNRTQVEEVMQEAYERLGQIDILVNNAGIASFESFLDITEESWNKTLQVNLTGTFHCAQVVSRMMAKQEGPSVIINMASTNGLLGEAGLAHYNASKAGVLLLTKTMAIELAAYNIRVNAVCPGLIRTELAGEGGMDVEALESIAAHIPMKRRGEVQEVASAFVFLASEDSSYMTGTELVLDGGQICQQQS